VLDVEVLVGATGRVPDGHDGQLLGLPVPELVAHPGLGDPVLSSPVEHL
jgi:hypothetical protein